MVCCSPVGYGVDIADVSPSSEQTLSTSRPASHVPLYCLFGVYRNTWGHCHLRGSIFLHIILYS